MDADFDMSPDLKLQCLELALKVEADSEDDILQIAKKFYEWISEPLITITGKACDVVSIVKKDEK